MKEVISPEPAALGGPALIAIPAELRMLLADVFALYVKTKGFHWHIGGRHFRDDHDVGQRYKGARATSISRSTA
jgi:DNA-binding ferritin-like protein